MSDYLPPEIWTEILLKLPVKTLINSTAVCKSWRSLITNPSFFSAHLENSETHVLLRRYDKYDKQEHYSLYKKNGPFGINSSSDLEFPFKSQIGYFRIVGSCDGLLCLSDDFFVNPSQPVIIWNPCVRSHVVLPESIINPKEAHIVILGFGVANNVYKVVRLVYCRKPYDYGFIVPPQAEIFTLSTGRWRRLSGLDVSLRLLEFMWCQIFLRGFVHWIAYEPMSDHSARSSVLTFHIGDEVFGEITLPAELAKEAVTSLSIAVMGETLGAIKYDGETGNERCDVWMMKEYGVQESWSKLYRIDLVGGFEKVIGFWGSAGEALLALQGLELASYNPETRWTVCLGIFGTPRSFYIDSYRESLLLFGGYSGAVEELSGAALQRLSLDADCANSDTKELVE